MVWSVFERNSLLQLGQVMLAPISKSLVEALELEVNLFLSF
jgi:hypothetical protein